MARCDRRQYPLVTFFVCASAVCLEAKLTAERDPSMTFSGYPLALKRCLNFKRLSSNVPLLRLVAGTKQSAVT